MKGYALIFANRAPQFAKQMGVRTDKPEVMFRPEDVELRTSTPRLEEEHLWCAATVNDASPSESGFKFYLQLTPDTVIPVSPPLDLVYQAFGRWAVNCLTFHTLLVWRMGPSRFAIAVCVGLSTGLCSWHIFIQNTSSACLPALPLYITCR